MKRNINNFVVFFFIDKYAVGSSEYEKKKNCEVNQFETPLLQRAN